MYVYVYVYVCVCMCKKTLIPWSSAPHKVNIDRKRKYTFGLDKIKMKKTKGNTKKETNLASFLLQQHLQQFPETSVRYSGYETKDRNKEIVGDTEKKIRVSRQTERM